MPADSSKIRNKKDAPQPLRLRRCFLWNEIKRLSFLAEVGESQCRGRLLLLVVPHAGDDEDDDRDHIGKDLIELGGG